MRFIDNGNLIKLLNFCFALLIFGGCATFTACQTKEQKIDAALQKCQAFLDKDNIDEAGDCYQQTIKANPDDAARISKAGEDAVFKRCLEFKDRKDYKGAIICLEGVVGLKPNSANVYFLLADSYFQYDKVEGYSTSGDFEILERAELTIKEGLKIKPEDAAAHGLYGEILSKKGKLKEAVLEYREAVKIEPKVKVFLIDLASAQEKTNDFTGAIESYNKALSLNPKDTLVLYFLGRLYEKSGETDKAIETLDKLFELSPDYDRDTKEMLNSLKEKRRVDQKQKTAKKAKAA